jgi:hypothetical protein
MEGGGDDRQAAGMAFRRLSSNCLWISHDGRWSYRVPGHVVDRMTGKHRIIIYGPKDDGTYLVESGQQTATRQTAVAWRTG